MLLLPPPPAPKKPAKERAEVVLSRELARDNIQSSGERMGEVAVPDLLIAELGKGRRSRRAHRGPRRLRAVAIAVSSVPSVEPSSERPKVDVEPDGPAGQSTLWALVGVKRALFPLSRLEGTARVLLEGPKRGEAGGDMRWAACRGDEAPGLSGSSGSWSYSSRRGAGRGAKRILREAGALREAPPVPVLVAEVEAEAISSVEEVVLEAEEREEAREAAGGARIGGGRGVRR